MNGVNGVSTFVLNITQHVLTNETLKTKTAMLQHSAASESAMFYGQGGFHNPKSSDDGGPKIIQGPHLSIMQLLLALLYVAIVWDILFIVSSLYFPSWLQRERKLSKGGYRRRHQHHNMAMVSGPAFTQRRPDGKMTLDFLWRRIMAEARRLQKADVQHRTITRVMMETRLEAKGQLERDRSLGKSSNSTMSRRLSTTVRDQKIDMVRWAARISSDHDPRVKKHSVDF